MKLSGRTMHLTIYDPADGTRLYTGSFPFRFDEWADGRPYRIAKAFLAAFRKHPLNERPDGTVCRRARAEVRMEAWGQQAGGVSRREG